MTEHPSIAAFMNSGHLNEPIQFSKCIQCGSEIYIGDEYIEHGQHDFCDMNCLTTAMLKEGNAERKVAGDDTVRFV